MTQPLPPGMSPPPAELTPALLLRVAVQMVVRVPTAVLVKNIVGNLAVLVDGEQVGYVNLRTGELELHADDPDEPERVPLPPEVPDNV